ncbi:MCE family protein [Oryzobacter sp. R7]|uniref:MCE family protein n=1 Tax=Oryzobacter faecalis TaxID=3388656 RepID=UPI00398D25B4
MTTHRVRARALTAVAATTALLLSGCSAAELPLPGGAEIDGRQMTVRADFADVLDLVPRSSVKINDVTVGEVTEIELSGWTARVTMRIPASAKLPDDARAELKQTSLLGEKYVALVRPETGGTGTLGDGDLIPLARTGRNPEVEEVLAAMSMLLNGGGVGQLKIIEAELNNAMRGNHEEIDSLISNLNTFIGGLDEQKADIVRAIDGIDRLSARLAERKDDLAGVLEETPKGLKILADQRAQLTEMLTALGRLGKVGSQVIRASREDTLANLAALRPVLGELNRAGDDLPRSLELLLTYPFPDAATQAIRGDYTNLWVTGDFDLRDIEVLPQPTNPGPQPTLPVPTLPVPTLPLPTVPLPTVSVPGVPLPTSTSTSTGGILCPPVCAQGEDRSWESLYTGGTS